MLERSQNEYEKTYNIRFSTRGSSVAIGDRVYVKRNGPRQHKLESKYVGPFRVLSKNMDSVTIRNLFNHKEQTVHLSKVFMVREEEVKEETNGEVQPKLYPLPPYEWGEEK